MQYYALRELNENARTPGEFIADCERDYDRKILETAQHILSVAAARPLVLLSGPSGSGKTTTALRIEALLDGWGHETHTLSMDNYFFRSPEVPLPRDEEGRPDLESPLCIDIALLKRHLALIAAGEPIEMPTFDFANQRRAEATIPFHRRPGEIVVMEGIHALNPEVVGEDTLARLATGIYVSVRTRLTDDGGYVLHPSKVRLACRLLRDQRGRGMDYRATVDRLASVSRGERLYIMPNKHRADVALDTFIPYELAVYRNELIAGLSQVDPGFLEDAGVSDLLPMLRQTAPIPRALVPENAMIREFIGKE